MVKRKQQHARSNAAQEQQPSPSVNVHEQHTSKKVVNKATQDTIVHRFEGVPWVPASVVALASSEDGSLCACLREDGDLELYDTGTEMMIKTIRGSKEAAPTSLVVKGDGKGVRAFVGSMDGTISEVDTHSGRIDRAGVSDSYGGAVWNLDIGRFPSSSEQGEEQCAIAAACDDGCVRIFEVEDDAPGVRLMKSLLPVEGRSLSVAWHPIKEQRIVVSGGTDGCVHVWNVDTGREMMRITVDGISGSSDPPCIWAVKVLSDGTIVSGDSLGQVTFWDGRFGTMLAKFNQHGADILALETSPQNDVVFASGIDPRISMYKKTSGAEGSAAWAYLSSKQEHALDVRALCCCPDASSARLFSGGNDSVLVSHSVDRFLKEHPRKINTTPQRPVVSLGQSTYIDGSPYIMTTASSNAIHIWKLPKQSDCRGYHDGDRLHVEDVPVCLVRLENKPGAHLTSVAISSDARFVAFADIEHTTCIELHPLLDVEEELKKTPSLVPIIGKDAESPTLGMSNAPIPGIPSGTTHLEFIPGTHTLVCFSFDGSIRIFDKDGSEEDSVTIRDIHDLRYKAWFKREAVKSSARREYPMIDSVSMSHSGEMVAIVVMNRVFLVSLQAKKIVSQIPSLRTTKEGSVVVAMQFVQDDTRLAIATSKSEIGLFDVMSGDLCCLPGQHEPQLHDVQLESNVLGMTTNPVSPAAVMVYSAYSLCHVDFSKPLVDEDHEVQSLGRRPRDKKLKMEAFRATKGRNCRVLASQHPILHTCSLPPQALVVIQKPWDHVWKEKSAPLFRHTYGT